MKILLIGEYSNVHWSLAEGLRQLGHQGTVVSDGDGWKNYPRDVDITRQSTGFCHTVRYLIHLKHVLKRLKGYDVVQLINPVFLELKPARILPFYKQLKRQNRSVFMGAYGMDRYWVKAGMDCTTLEYSDFNLGTSLRTNADNDRFISEWLYGDKGWLNKVVAFDCQGIVAGLYEYHAAYTRHFRLPEKVRFIPFPVPVASDCEPRPTHHPVRFFIGIQSQRSAYKGTDIMLKALQRLAHDYPHDVEMVIAEDVPFQQYARMMEHSDVLLDQLYSYTPAMNGLLAMSKGLVLVGGGEEEHYKLLGEEKLRPIVNVKPNEESVYTALKQLLEDPHLIYRLKKESIAYVRRHHDPVRVAQQYVDFWQHMQKPENQHLSHHIL